MKKVKVTENQKHAYKNGFTIYNGNKEVIHCTNRFAAGGYGLRFALEIRTGKSPKMTVSYINKKGVWKATEATSTLREHVVISPVVVIEPKSAPGSFLKIVNHKLARKVG